MTRFSTRLVFGITAPETTPALRVLLCRRVLAALPQVALPIPEAARVARVPAHISSYRPHFAARVDLTESFRSDSLFLPTSAMICGQRILWRAVVVRKSSRGTAFKGSRP